jgi:hypothetical protein
VPMFLAALTDLKSAYVEVANPLLAARVLRCVRQMPDRLRTDKRLWRRFVKLRGPSIPYASRSALLELPAFFRGRGLLELLLAEVESAQAGLLLSPALRAYVGDILKARLRNLDPRPSTPSGPRSRLGASLPRWARFTARRIHPERPVLDPLELAFRAFVVARMGAVLSADCGVRSARHSSVANLRG